MKYHNKKFGFTLAEVLVTLGIIGVVAALTLPAVISNYQKSEVANKLKVSYSILNQGLKDAESDYGPYETWEFKDSSEIAEKYFVPYFKKVKVFTEVPSGFHIYCPGQVECDGYGGYTTIPKLVLPNGVIFAPGYISDSKGSKGMTIIVDLNGMKGPNTYGRDVFMFVSDPQKGIVPYGTGLLAGGAYQEVNRDYLYDGEGRACARAGLFCAALIMYDSWEIKDDYPWRI